MAEDKYLKDESYYIDLYDLFTIKECLRVIHFWQKAYKEEFNNEEIKDLPQKEKIKGFNHFLNQELFTTKGERYRRKKERIKEMMEDDRKKQEFYDNVKEPSNILCNTCGKRLYSDTKILEDYMNQPMRVLFFFPCKACKEKRAVYNTGAEFVSKASLCPKCGKELEENHKIKNNSKGKIIIWTRSCPSCKFFEEEVDDFNKKHLEWQKKEQEDKELLDKHRNDFCLSAEKGQEYIGLIEKMKYAKVVFEEEKRKYDSTVYQKSLQLKKLSIIELEKLLTELLEKEKYSKLSFDKPEIAQYVIVPFTAQDANSSRKGFDSESNLQKLIKNALEYTNWRLVSNSLTYRLGYVAGQLKGYEREEDMLELSGKKKEQKPPQEDYERKMKYGSDNIVQIARLMGEMEGVENMRKKRLEEEPEGFLLEASEGPYNCRVCHELTQGNKAWWDLNGIKCLDCQRNIKEGVIPAEICKNDDIWIKDWQLRYDYSLHGSTIRKLQKEGLLHGRELKRQDGSTYFRIYLLEENKEFLKKYPKKPAMKIKYIDPLGQEFEL